MTETKRSNQCNKALHLLFAQISNEMLAQGIERRTVVEDLEGYSCPIDESFVKEVWRAIQWTQTGKKSTTEITSQEVDRVYDTFNKFLSESYGIHLPFPNMMDLLRAYDESYQQD